MTPPDLPPLIPRRVLFGNPERTRALLSPDGRRLSYLAPRDGVLNIWVAPADAPEQARPVTNDTHRGIREYDWAYTNRHLLYLQDQDGDENWRIHCVDLESGTERCLTPGERVQARVQEISPRFPDDILVALNTRDPQLHDLYRIDLHTGRSECVLENPGFIGFETDDFVIHLAQAMTPDGGFQLVRPDGDGAWSPFLLVGPEDALSTGPVGFDPEGTGVYLLDSRDRDTAALVHVTFRDGRRTVLAEDTRADAGEVERHPRRKTIDAVAFNYTRRRWHVLAEDLAEDFATLERVADGDFRLAARTLDDRRWIVSYELDRGPLRYYLYDRDTRRAVFLFTNRPALEGARLAAMHPVEIPARDGLSLVSYLSLPTGLDTDGFRPPNPLPLVLLVHGGPWARDEWGYDAWHQWLANRGYAVLSVNFRGSTGFGKAFLNAANGEWGGRMHTDLLDAVAWAVREGIADPRRVAIMGGSYGGYAVLWALTNSPEVFACGVDIVGPSNLITLLESIPPYWEPMIELFTTRVGDHRTPAGRQFLTERSPLTHVQRLVRPLLIGQGANDPRVKQAESDQVVNALRSKGIPVTYVLYPDEGHGFARPENSLSFNAVAEAFLAQHLGGRCEPVGRDFAGASLSIPVGGEHIPELAANLAERDG